MSLSRSATSGNDANSRPSSSKRGVASSSELGPGRAPGTSLGVDRLAPSSASSPAARGAVKHTINRRDSPTSSATSSPRLSPRVPPISTNIAVKVPKLAHASKRPGSETPSDVRDESPLDPILASMMPSFLKLDRQAMDAKFEDINWDERIRMAKGLSSHPNFDWKWSTFPQAEANRKGAMDRYCNIKPWNHNRVKLLVTKGQLDYVNASHIEAPPSHDSSLSPLRYIAMQGPTEPSVPYVWRMISEQSESPSVIVQLTSNTEGNFAKCNQYFPDGLASDNTTNTRQHNQWSLNEHNVWGDGWSATLTLESVEFLCSDAIEKRRLSLKVARERYPRVVWHFWYRRWPDFGVIHPEDYATFFELMRLSREHSCPGAPRIIHCSAGVGRTGTFITLEHLLRELDVGAFHPSQFSNRDDNNKDDSNSDPDFVYDTVSHLRQQRKGMVQSDQQYRFLYQVLRRRWIELYKTRGVEDDEEDDNYGGVTLANGIATTNKGDNTKTNAKSTSTSNQLTDVESYDDNDDDDDDDDEDDDEGGAKVKNDSATAPATATATAIAPSDMTVGGVSVSDKLRTVNRSKPFSSGGGRAAMMKKRAKRLLFD